MREYKTTNNEIAKHIIVRSCFKIVGEIANVFYFYNQDQDYMDLVQYGFKGLLVALEKYDIKYDKVRFGTFAKKFIKFYISNGLYELKSYITYPQHYYETSYFLSLFIDKFYYENKRYPKPIEILNELNWRMYSNVNLETVRYILNLNSVEYISIEEAEEQGLLGCYIDTIDIDLDCLRKGLAEGIKQSLNPRYRKIIEMRFGILRYKRPIRVAIICKKHNFSRSRFDIIYQTSLRQMSWHLKYSDLINYYYLEEEFDCERF